MSLRFRTVAAASHAAVLALAAAGGLGCSSETTTTRAPDASSPSPTEPVPGEGEDAAAPPVNATAYSEADVQKLFDLQCVRCHDATSTNVDLSAPFTKDTVGVATGGATGKTICGRGSDFALRIAPGDRQASLLWHKVNGTQDCGSKMPFGPGSKALDATQIERLGLYIDALPKK